MLTVMKMTVSINWCAFKEGTSFFVPCIDRSPVVKYIRKEARIRKFKIVVKQVVENGVYGVRVWRVI